MMRQAQPRPSLHVTATYVAQELPPSVRTIAERGQAMTDENRVVVSSQDDERQVFNLYFRGRSEPVPIVWGQAPDSELIEFRSLWRYAKWGDDRYQTSLAGQP